VVAGVLRCEADIVLRGGMIAAALMGDPNASIPTPQPVHYRRCSAPSAGVAGVGGDLSAERRDCRGVPSGSASSDDLPARGIRAVDKSRMVHNSATPRSSRSRNLRGARRRVHLTCEPATILPWHSAIFCIEEMISPRIRRTRSFLSSTGAGGEVISTGLLA